MNQDDVLSKNPLYVTRPDLPPLADFMPSLEEIWSSRILTNNGPFCQDFEKELGNYLGVEHVSVTSSGTMALYLALLASDLTGKVITTPFTFVATAHVIRLAGLTPVFVDVEEDSLALDPECVAAAIEPSTAAILPVHCYGFPAPVEDLRAVADNAGIPIIYDGAHAFGASLGSASLASFGDYTALSFHATKVFNTIEGGAIVSSSRQAKLRIDSLRNFGFAGETSVESLGFNGKMSEVNSALGLLQLKRIDQEIERRAAVRNQYYQILRQCSSIEIPFPRRPDYTANWAYMPILVTHDAPHTRDGLVQALRDQGVLARKYFYPLLTDLSPYRGVSEWRTPVADDVARRVLTLPLFGSMTPGEVDKVASIVVDFMATQ